jgi:hypothetical protein
MHLTHLNLGSDSRKIQFDEIVSCNVGLFATQGTTEMSLFGDTFFGTLVANKPMLLCKYKTII